MRQLYLDYLHDFPSYKWMGYIVLTVSALLTISLLNYYREIKVEQERLNSELRALSGVKPASSSATKSINSEESTHIKIITDRLNLPWKNLFLAVEQAQIKGIALLSMQPDIKKKAINIVAETKSETTMLEYLRRLNATGAFVDVHLINHQIQQADPQRPVQFTVAAFLEKQNK